MKKLALTLALATTLPISAADFWTSDADFKEGMAVIAKASSVYQTYFNDDSVKSNELKQTLVHGCKTLKTKYNNTTDRTEFMKKYYPKIDAICNKYL
ncbi:hypothetical protein [Thalassotalea hakodatensis]|uniref:hypothetical protein n=1 Tax=Thalassotalea hakodatensis TaxID=3030492 RepID=UPI002574759B|nr:hypothetical protein [Thalassotalea hakodatensis]